MGKVLLLLLVLSATVVVFAKKSLSEDLASVQFSDFKEKYNKQYATPEEEAARFENFKASIKRAAVRNVAEGSIVFGVTKFSDLTPAEFKARWLNNKVTRTPTAQRKQTPIPADVTLPTAYDWRPLGAVTPVKNQEQCGSCWAFSATEEIESTWILAGKGTNTTTILAPQQIVDCDTVDQGCDGGDTPTAYAYVEKAGGLEAEVSYPYKAVDGRCKFSASKVVASINGFTYATKLKTNPQAEQQMQAALVATAPISICVEADTWQDYTGGIITSNCGTQLDHCVQIVGYATSQAKNIEYWIIRNSWATDWGINGYIYVEIGKNLCGVREEATITTVAK
jgi:cathepsin F